MMHHKKNRNVLYPELKNIKYLITVHHPYYKNICISCHIVRTDKKKRMSFFYNNIFEPHPYTNGLHFNSNGTTMLAGKFVSRIRRL